MYKLVKHHRTGANFAVIVVDGDRHTVIPFDEGNTDYQQYLKWVEEGNTPLPADEGAA
jgi:hypothetical protein